MLLSLFSEIMGIDGPGRAMSSISSVVLKSWLSGAKAVHRKKTDFSS